ncbi:MAG: DUF4271 domain-containing protein [Bacteroidetes bacterium]|nr:DUF4271 domain-containing protein [Bacteroidota bacterium]
MKLVRKHLILLCLNAVFLVSVLDAQRSDNPFDIQGAPPAEEAAVDQVPLTGNPFDIRTPPVEQAVVEAPIRGTRPVESMDEEVRKTGRFRFVLVLSILLLLTVVVSLFRNIIQKAYRSFLNDNFLNQMHRDQTGITSWPYLVLYLLFFFQLGTCIYLSGLERGWFPDTYHWRGLWQTVGFVGGLIFLKHLVLFIISKLYPVEKEAGVYSFTMVIFGIITGLILIPFNLLLAYGPEGLRNALVFISLGLVLVVLFYRSVRGVLTGSRLLALHLFHFLLYICTVEIAPVVWLYKLLQAQMM